MQTGQERSKLSFLTDDMIVCAENPDRQKTGIGNYSKIVGYEINIKKKVNHFSIHQQRTCGILN